ncbi:MAG: hypothetical protein KGZ50_07270 [Peptococcaceae bacterium]|nr:hypothetical protein [Peptococcaceae bacterium]
MVRRIEGWGYNLVNFPSALMLVKEAYRKQYLENKPSLLIDSRCPKVVELVKEEYQQLISYLAPIEPILTTCAQGLYEEYIKPNPLSARLIMVTPCTDFVAYGAKKLPGQVRFITWKDFLREIDERSSFSRSVISPVPLGFFDGMGIPVVKVSGAKEITSLLAATIPKTDSGYILEILYCPQGCHNGDGFHDSCGEAD